MLRKLLKEREEEGKSSYVSEDKVEEVKGKNINVLTEPTDGAVVLPLYSSLSPSQQQVRREERKNLFPPFHSNPNNPMNSLSKSSSPSLPTVTAA